MFTSFVLYEHLHLFFIITYATKLCFCQTITTIYFVPHYGSIYHRTQTFPIYVSFYRGPDTSDMLHDALYRMRYIGCNTSDTIHRTRYIGHVAYRTHATDTIQRTRCISDTMQYIEYDTRDNFPTDVR